MSLLDLSLDSRFTNNSAQISNFGSPAKDCLKAVIQTEWVFRGLQTILNLHPIAYSKRLGVDRLVVIHYSAICLAKLTNERVKGWRIMSIEGQ